MAQFTVPMPHQDFAFDGKRIGPPVDNRRGDSGKLRPRWLELSLYRTAAGTYVVERIAHSVVIHEQNAPCVPEGKADERGSVIPVTEMPEGAVPCYQASLANRRECHPSLDAGLVRLEQPKITVFRSTDTGEEGAAQVIAWLSEARRRGGGISDAESRPVAALLEQARRKDRAFRIHPVVEIT